MPEMPNNAVSETIAEVAAEPAAATPAEGARQSFGRMLHTFGDMFSSRASPAQQPDRPTDAELRNWAVQMSAPKSEAGAKRELKRLNAKYASDLNGSTIATHKARVDGETIYRLRVVGLSKADATVLCARLKGDGGNCFIAK